MDDIKNIDDKLDRLEEMIKKAIQQVVDAGLEEEAREAIITLRQAEGFIIDTQRGEEELVYEDPKFSLEYIDLFRQVSSSVGKIHGYYQKQAYKEFGWITHVKYEEQSVGKLKTDGYIDDKFTNDYIEMKGLINNSVWVRVTYYDRQTKQIKLDRLREMLKEIKEVEQTVLPKDDQPQ